MADYTPRPFYMEALEVEGSWYDIGKAQGQAMRALVHQSVHTYVKFKQCHAGQSGIRALPELMRRVTPFMDQHFPEEWAELHGVADGAEVDLAWLVAVNFQDAFSTVRQECPADNAVGTQCGGLMFPDSDQGPLIGGTLDCLPNRFWVTFRPSGGPAFQSVVFPGWVAGVWGGVNSAGLALCGASSAARRKENQVANSRIAGFDTMSANRVLLRSCRSVEEALQRLAEPDLCPAGHLAMLDRSGRGALIQGRLTQGPGLRVTELESDVGLCWGNFYPWDINPETYEEQDTPEGQSPFDAFSRYGSLRRTVDQHRGRYTLTAMREVLTSHDGPPDKPHSYSVCNDNTDLAMIVAPRSGKLWLACQPPCVQGFRAHSFTS